MVTFDMLLPAVTNSIREVFIGKFIVTEVLVFWCGLLCSASYTFIYAKINVVNNILPVIKQATNKHNVRNKIQIEEKPI